MKTAVLSCTLCPFETKTRVALRRHFSIVHELESTKKSQTEIKCAQCEKSYKGNETSKDCMSKFHKAKKMKMRIP